MVKDNTNTREKRSQKTGLDNNKRSACQCDSFAATKTTRSHHTVHILDVEERQDPELKYQIKTLRRGIAGRCTGSCV